APSTKATTVNPRIRGRSSIDELAIGLRSSVRPAYTAGSAASSGGDRHTLPHPPTCVPSGRTYRRSRSLRSFVENGEVPVVHEEPVPTLARQLACDLEVDQEVHRRRDGGEREAGRVADARHRLNRPRLERVMDPPRGARTAAGPFDARTVG